MKTFALLTLAVTLSLGAQTTEPTKKDSEKKDAGQQPAPVEAKPSETVIGEGSKACVPGDNSPAGTVSNGYKKVIEATPFGNACRWVAIK